MLRLQPVEKGQDRVGPKHLVPTCLAASALIPLNVTTGMQSHSINCVLQIPCRMICNRVSCLALPSTPTISPYAQSQSR